jgi:glutamate dehydrogenase (NAD(P)+)
MEYQGASQSAAMATIEEKLRRNTVEVLQTAKDEQILPREAAMVMARKRIERAMSFCRWNLF